VRPPTVRRHAAAVLGHGRSGPNGPCRGPGRRSGGSGGGRGCQNWQANFLTYASEHLAALGLTAEDLAPVTAAQADWDPAYAANNTIQITARSSTQLKNDRRAAYDEAIRELVRRIQASPLVTDDERRALGITVPGDHPTPVGPPSSRPLAIVDPSDRFRHRIRYSDEGSTTSRARPAGTIGCEVLFIPV
jgi:hypothetical protein